MSKVDIKDMKGKKIKEETLPEEIFGQKVNEQVLAQVIRSQVNSRRSGTASTKGRSDVTGGGAKPWRQKGTGRARAGTIRSPLWVGGGIVFGPKPRDYGFKVPKKMKFKAIISALSAKAQAGELLIIDKIDMKKPKTKTIENMFKKWKIDNKVTQVVPDEGEVIIKSVRNIPKAKAIKFSQLNPYDILDNNLLILTKESYQKIKEVYS